MWLILRDSENAVISIDSPEMNADWSKKRKTDWSEKSAGDPAKVLIIPPGLAKDRLFP